MKFMIITRSTSPSTHRWHVLYCSKQVDDEIEVLTPTGKNTGMSIQSVMTDLEVQRTKRFCFQFLATWCDF